MISITRTLSGIKLASSQMFKSAIVPIHDRAGSYIVIKKWWSKLSEHENTLQ